MDFNVVCSGRAYSSAVTFAKKAMGNLSDISEKAASKSRDFCAFSARTAQNESAPAPTQNVENSSAQTDSENNAEEKSLNEMIREQMDRIDSLFSDSKDDNSKDSKLNAILNKFNSGLMLTSTEQQYLALKDPDTYSSYQKISVVRSMYRSSLSVCGTRDDVNFMRLSNSLSALAEYKKAIKGGGDGADIRRLNAALESEMSSYVKAGNYQRLPTSAECNKFDADLAKARKYEREKRLEKRLDPTGKKKKIHKFPGDGKRTVAQVMNSPLGRKVLAARRKSAGVSCGMPGGFPAKINFKI